MTKRILRWALAGALCLAWVKCWAADVPVTRLQQLKDVRLTSLQTDQALVWNGSKWVNNAPSTNITYINLSNIVTLAEGTGITVVSNDVNDYTISWNGDSEGTLTVTASNFVATSTGASEFDSVKVTNGFASSTAVVTNTMTASNVVATTEVKTPKFVAPASTDLIFTVDYGDAITVADDTGRVSFQRTPVVSFTDYIVTESVNSPSDQGSHASPSTANPLSPTWTGWKFVVWQGATGTINLPAVATYFGKELIVYNTGAFTVTIDPSGTEVIVRDGHVMDAGQAMILPSGAGNYVHLICDGARWITLDRIGTLTE